jgi:predicted dehydrogenase
MSLFDPAPISRRQVLTTSGKIAAASALATVIVPRGVHAAESATIKLALVGCGGRGTSAVGEDAFISKHVPVKLVAMADVFENRLKSSFEGLNKKHQGQMDVPPERQFVGFDGYKKAMDCLSPGDIVILATPPAFRWVHFTYAIEKGLNVFMEKPVAVDGPSAKRMMELGEKAKAKNLKVAVGLMCRHCASRKELHQRIQDGAIGEVTLLRAYRMAGPTGSAFATAPNADMSELMYQIKNFHSFLWASGGAYSDFLIHNIDESCWMKNGWPIKAQGLGGRHYRGDYVDQNFDSYSTEFTFADGTKLILEGRTVKGCYNEFASYAHGTKGSARISTSSHHPSKARLYNSQKMEESNAIWQAEKDEVSPYHLEWDDFLAAIKQDQPYNEVQRGAEASLVTAMGRRACHTGQEISYEQMLNCPHEFAPHVNELTADSPPPLTLLPNGKYPVPQPGIVSDREYLTSKTT